MDRVQRELEAERIQFGHPEFGVHPLRRERCIVCEL